MRMREFTKKQLLFARALAKGLNSTSAYREAYEPEDPDSSTTRNAAYVLARRADIQRLVSEIMAEELAASRLSKEWIIRQDMAIVTGDVNELVEGRRVCCRNCHGVGFSYQWESVEEWQAEVTRVERKNKRLKAEDHMPLPEPIGGFEFNPKADPHVDCPKCGGLGQLLVVVGDTRNLSPEGKAMYRGIKQTANGLEVKIADKDAALARLSKYLGMDKTVLEHVGANGGPIKSISTITADPKEASQLYTDMMRADPN